MRSILRYHLISMACIHLCSSAVRVHDSQAYRKMNETRERSSRVLELKELLLSFQTGLNLVNAVVCVILESISDLELSSDTTYPRYLKLVTVSSFYSFTVISLLMPLVLFLINLVFPELNFMPWAVELCRDVQLILPFLPRLLPGRRCHQQSGGWWLFCLQRWQCLRDLPRRLSWPFPEICWRGWVRVDIPVEPGDNVAVP